MQIIGCSGSAIALLIVGEVGSAGLAIAIMSVGTGLGVFLVFGRGEREFD